MPKRKALTAIQKKEICQKKQKFPVPTNKELADEYEVGTSTISDIIKEKDKWNMVDINSFEANRKRDRKPKWPQLEEAMQIWTDAALTSGQDLSQAVLIAKGKKFAENFGYEDFKGDGWINGFQERIGLKQHIKHGEAASGPSSEELNLHHQQLRQLCERYTLDNIWNADETGLFWKMRPSRTLTKGNISGYKKDKARVSLLLACNAIGTERLPPLFIHYHENPCILRHVNKRRLPV